MLVHVVFEILHSAPQNTFQSKEELWERVLERVPRARREDFERAVGKIHVRFGLAVGWIERGDTRVWGIALHSRVTEMPPNALLVIGARINPPMP